MAAVRYRGLNAVTNFDLSRYIDGLQSISGRDGGLQPISARDGHSLQPTSGGDNAGGGRGILTHHTGIAVMRAESSRGEQQTRLQQERQQQEQGQMDEAGGGQDMEQWQGQMNGQMQGQGELKTAAVGVGGEGGEESWCRVEAHAGGQAGGAAVIGSADTVVDGALGRERSSEGKSGGGVEWSAGQSSPVNASESDRHHPHVYGTADGGAGGARAGSPPVGGAVHVVAGEAEAEAEAEAGMAAGRRGAKRCAGALLPGADGGGAAGEAAEAWTRDDDELCDWQTHDVKVMEEMVG